MPSWGTAEQQISRLSDIAEQCEVQDLQNEPRCDRSWKRDETVKERDAGVFLSDRDFEAVSFIA